MIMHDAIYAVVLTFILSYPSRIIRLAFTIPDIFAEEWLAGCVLTAIVITLYCVLFACVLKHLNYRKLRARR